MALTGRIGDGTTLAAAALIANLAALAIAVAELRQPSRMPRRPQRHGPRPRI